VTPLEPDRPDAPDPSELAPDHELESALAHVAQPVARAEFREDLRRRFMTAARGASTVPLVDVVEDPPVRSTRAGSSRSTRWVWAAAAAAAASVVVALFAIKPHESRWNLVGGPWTGSIKVDDVLIPISDQKRLREALADAHDIETKDRIEFVFGQWYGLDLAAGTHVLITPMEQRTRPEPLGFQVKTGALRVFTGPEFRGAELVVATDDLTARITGTNLGVDVLSDGTCVCCSSGNVKVTLPSRSGADVVPANGQLRVYNDKQPAKHLPIHPMHEPPMKELEAACRKIW
jgi:hypothetical protein